MPVIDLNERLVKLTEDPALHFANAEYESIYGKFSKPFKEPEKEQINRKGKEIRRLRKSAKEKGLPSPDVSAPLSGNVELPGLAGYKLSWRLELAKKDLDIGNFDRDYFGFFCLYQKTLPGELSALCEALPVEVRRRLTGTSEGEIEKALAMRSEINGHGLGRGPFDVINLMTFATLAKQCKDKRGLAADKIFNGLIASISAETDKEISKLKELLQRALPSAGKNKDGGVSSANCLSVSDYKLVMDSMRKTVADSINRGILMGGESAADKNELSAGIEKMARCDLPSADLSFSLACHGDEMQPVFSVARTDEDDESFRLMTSHSDFRLARTGQQEC